MNKVQLSISRQWFDSYSHTFAGEDRKFPPMLQLKYDHSFRVEKLAYRISRELEWPKGDVMCSQAIGLLHDVGRFPQYDRYGTFYDPSSVDHGDLGQEVLIEEFPWDYFDTPVPSRILVSVQYHNKRTLPEEIDPELLPFVRLVRDADKLDVFGVVREHVSNGSVRDLLPGIDLEEVLSQSLVREIEEEGSASYSNVSTLLDFLLVQTTWILDMNYSPSFRIMEENGTLEWLRQRICSDPASEKIFDMVQQKIVRHACN